MLHYFRSQKGLIYYSMSKDGGSTWGGAKPTQVSQRKGTLTLTLTLTLILWPVSVRVSVRGMTTRGKIKPCALSLDTLHSSTRTHAHCGRYVIMVASSPAT